ncbi:hypothetical protein GGTG_07337 [Gaeumannomyces tritici R3-111a-1]|uniref:Uncharacterized protein n=1 Tax=Gaeumannomyces tritici (strain R3-111a-1) TaxID=644352 RepID=J3P1E0_GAET3|nr:hypothetical protein GGTG_07337 [Gaeumannomyces tritici R3-111a-1]EJT77425.1 hypothetical protein GGTG_07337 [Gaeumannomyces tritici R3-111a-1]
MIAMGGRDFRDKRGDLEDPWRGGMKILDMTELVWRDDYDASAPVYRQPGVAKEWYSDRGLPNVTWEIENTRLLFQDVIDSEAQRKSPPPAVSEPTAGSVVAPTPGPPIGAIVGGVLGGLAAVLIAAVVCVYMWRRRHRQVGDAVVAERREKDEATYSAAMSRDSAVMAPDSAVTELYFELGME